jgi:hypothetical protein
VREPIRLLAVFLVSLLALCVLAGRERLTAPSHDNHYSHLAAAWLDGRLAHEGKPPGWCGPEERRAKQCKQHHFDDWSVVWTLTLRDETQVRGYPCKTAACEQRRKRGVDAWWVIGEGLREFERGEIRMRTDTWYVSFPPAPALVMLPAVAIWGTAAWDVLITCILAALIPVVLLRWFDRERGLAEGRARDHLWAVAAWTFASPALLLGSHGRVWFTAQILGALFTCLHLSAGWRCRRPGWAGLWLGLAVACRPHMAFALPFFALEWWRETKGRARLHAALRFALPLALIGGALMWMNHARFGDPLEFGHRYLEIRWQQRMQEVGMFSTDYLARNLQCALSLLPVWREGPWDGALPRVSLHGSSILLGAPWLLALAWSREVLPQRLGLVLAALAVAIPSLLYQNSGQIQFSYRFALDWLPMLLAAIVFGGGARGWAFRGLVVLGGLWQAYGAWYFGRKPGLLFVTQPLGWPFESELET